MVIQLTHDQSKIYSSYMLAVFVDTSTISRASTVSSSTLPACGDVPRIGVDTVGVRNVVDTAFESEP